MAMANSVATSWSRFSTVMHVGSRVENTAMAPQVVLLTARFALRSDRRPVSC